MTFIRHLFDRSLTPAPGAALRQQLLYTLNTDRLTATAPFDEFEIHLLADMTAIRVVRSHIHVTSLTSSSLNVDCAVVRSDAEISYEIEYGGHRTGSLEVKPDEGGI